MIQPPHFDPLNDDTPAPRTALDDGEPGDPLLAAAGAGAGRGTDGERIAARASHIAPAPSARRTPPCVPDTAPDNDVAPARPPRPLRTDVAAPTPAPPSALAGPPARTIVWGALAAGARECWPRLVCLLALLLTWSGLLLVLFPEMLAATPPPLAPFPGHAGWVVAIAAILPPVLAWLIYALINKRALYQHVQPRLPRGLHPSLEAMVPAAEASWTYEMTKAHCSLARAEVFAALWGTITSLSIAISVMLLLPPIQAAQVPFDKVRAPVAFAVIGATVVSFLLELSRLSIRTSNDDPTKRMFAEALRTLILAVVSTLVLVLMLPVFGLEPLKRVGDSPAAALGFGAGIAIMGPPAFEWTRARLASLFGIEQKRVARGTALELLEDIGSEEIMRLSEEGIDTVEALVNTPIPRLFLCTRYSLQRIIAWHDFGLLVTRVGAGPAADLRARWGLRGSAEVRRVVLDTADPQAKEVLRGIFKKTMRVDGDEEAGLVIERIARDDRVTLLEVMRHVVLQRRSRPAPGLEL
jgi:hypothetical protein